MGHASSAIDFLHFIELSGWHVGRVKKRSCAEVDVMVYCFCINKEGI